jgi:maleate cis-trans isomerase
VVLLTPYKSNQPIVDYLASAGISVLRDVALALEAKDFAGVTPEQWTALAADNDCAEADGIFLSCANTTQIEAVAAVERRLGKPAVNSNQAVLWGCLRRLHAQLTPLPSMPHLGRLLQQA